MKKIILILAIGLTSCSKPTNNPVPIKPTPTSLTISANTYLFTGEWDCLNWEVNTTTGQSIRRRFVMYNENLTECKSTLSQFNPDSTLNQTIHSHTHTLIDTNYFDVTSVLSGLSFKGILTTDTTLLVYQYEVDPFGVVDTIQTKQFKKQ